MNIFLCNLMYLYNLSNFNLNFVVWVEDNLVQLIYRLLSFVFNPHKQFAHTEKAGLHNFGGADNRKILHKFVSTNFCASEE